MGLSPLEIAEFLEKHKHDRDLKNMIDTARQEGIKTGREVGRYTEIVQNALKMGLSIHAIAELTGLSQEEIERLKK